EIAGALSSRLRSPARNALALEAENRAAIGVGRHRQRHLAGQRGNRDFAAQDRFAKRDRQIELQIVALAGEIGVRSNRDGQKYVAGRTAMRARTALTLQADLLAVLETSGNSHIEVAPVGEGHSPRGAEGRLAEAHRDGEVVILALAGLGAPAPAAAEEIGENVFGAEAFRGVALVRPVEMEIARAAPPGRR